MKPLVLLLLALVGSPEAATAPPPAPLGPEVALDAPATHGECPTIAGHADGAFAVTWRGTTPTWRGEGIMVRTAGSDGVFAPPRRIDESDMASLHGLTTAGAGYRLAWQHFWWGDEISQVETLDRTGRITHSVGFHHWPGQGWLSPRLTGHDDWGYRLSLRPTGGYVATWIGVREDGSQRGPRILVQLLDPEGHPASVLTAWDGAPGFNGHDGCSQHGLRPLHHPSNGQFVVLWEEEARLEGHDPIDKGTLGRRFAADGKPLGEIVQLLPAPPAGERNIVAAAIGADGTMALTWAVAGGVPDHIGHVRLRTFAADGSVLGTTVVVPRWRSCAETSFPQSIAVDPDGNVLLVWSQYANPSARGALARVYSRQAVQRGAAFPFASAASADHPRIVGATAGWAGAAWLIAWVGAGSPSVNAGCLGSGGQRCPPPPELQTYVRRFARY